MNFSTLKNQSFSKYGLETTCSKIALGNHGPLLRETSLPSAGESFKVIYGLILFCFCRLGFELTALGLLGRSSII
jgi:hypothetical protein